MKAFSITVRALVLVALLALSATSATVERLNLTQLTHSARAIVVGTVSEVTSFEAGDRSTIYTKITLDVSDNLKGARTGAYSFTQLGGVIGDRRVSVAGFPTFNPGQELLLFLNNDPSGTIATVGLGQGKFVVKTDETTGIKQVVNDVVGLEVIADGSLTTPETISMSLDDMKTKIRETLNTPSPKH